MKPRLSAILLIRSTLVSPSIESTDDVSESDKPATPWYNSGLKFRCTQCGHCCTGTPGFVWVDDDEIAAIAEHLDKPLGEIRLMHTRPHARGVSLTEFANGDCTFLDPKTRACRIYAARPRQCRTWPFWNSNLDDEDGWAEAGETCPGVGQGDFFPLEDIEAQAAVIDI